MHEIREKIETIDSEIIKMLAERQRLSKNIGRIKTENNLEIEDSNREEKLQRLHSSLSQELQIDHNYVKRIFRIILNESKRIQDDPHKN